jgi:predicted  nucleic acid-binding Zn-ribbon protein
MSKDERANGYDNFQAEQVWRLRDGALLRIESINGDIVEYVIQRTDGSWPEFSIKLHASHLSQSLRNGGAVVTDTLEISRLRAEVERLTAERDHEAAERLATACKTCGGSGGVTFPEGLAEYGRDFATEICSACAGSGSQIVADEVKTIWDSYGNVAAKNEALSAEVTRLSAALEQVRVERDQLKQNLCVVTNQMADANVALDWVASELTDLCKKVAGMVGEAMETDESELAYLVRVVLKLHDDRRNWQERAADAERAAALLRAEINSALERERVTRQQRNQARDELSTAMEEGRRLRAERDGYKQIVDGQQKAREADACKECHGTGAIGYMVETELGPEGDSQECDFCFGSGSQAMADKLSAFIDQEWGLIDELCERVAVASGIAREKFEGQPCYLERVITRLHAERLAVAQRVKARCVEIAEIESKRWQVRADNNYGPGAQACADEALQVAMLIYSLDVSAIGGEGGGGE